MVPRVVIPRGVRTAAFVAVAALALSAAACRDKPGDEDCVKSGEHVQELWFKENPDQAAVWASRSPEEQAEQRALYLQSCQNSGRASEVKCILAATTHSDALTCTK